MSACVSLLMRCLLQANQNNVQEIEPDVRSLVYTQAVASGGLDAYMIMQEIYLHVSPCSVCSDLH